MLLIRNRIDHNKDWSQEHQQTFLKSCELYINNLIKDGRLISAQPIVREGKIISGTTGEWKVKPLKKTGEVQVGYYHILAEDIKEAVEIAKINPEFAFSTTARIEVRPVKTKETTTAFVYPNKHLQEK